MVIWELVVQLSEHSTQMRRFVCKENMIFHLARSRADRIPLIPAPITKTEAAFVFMESPHEMKVAMALI